LSRYFPDWQSRAYEQHGHMEYDIYIDVQRPMLIDVNIRDLACFIEIRSKKDITTRYGKVVNQWQVRRFESNAELERYLSSGRKDATCYTEETITSDYNVHECYNSKMCKPKFFDHHIYNDFNTHEHEPLEETLDGFVKYLQEQDDEIPQGYYQKGAL